MAAADSEEGSSRKRVQCDECDDLVGIQVWYDTCRFGVHTQGRHKKPRKKTVSEQSQQEQFPAGWAEEGAANEDEGASAVAEEEEEETAAANQEELEEIEREIAQEVWEDAFEELAKEFVPEDELQPEEEEQYWDALAGRRGVDWHPDMGGAPDRGGNEFGDVDATPAAENEDGPPLREPEHPRSFWWQKRDEKLYEGSPYTVRETAFHLLSQKVKHNTKDNEFNDRCRLEHHHLRPPGNLYPPSLHVCKVVLGVEPIQAYSKHVCVNDCYGSFPDLPEAEWAAHAEDKCPVCKTELRFASYRVAGGVKYKPRKEYWDFGLRETIREYFADPEYCRLRRSDRRDRSDFWSGEYAQRIDEWSGKILLELDNGAWEIGLDWGQVYNFKQRSTGFVMIRPLDIPPEHRGEARFCKVLAVLPGPKEPKNLQTYLQRTFAGFKELGPFGEWILITKCQCLLCCTGVLQALLTLTASLTCEYPKFHSPHDAALIGALGQGDEVKATPSDDTN